MQGHADHWQRRWHCRAAPFVGKSPYRRVHDSVANLGDRSHRSTDSSNMTGAKAAFIVKKSKMGNMSIKETTTFTDNDAANEIAKGFAGQLVSLAKIADATVLDPADSK